MEDLKQSIDNSNLIYAAMRNFPNPVCISDVTLNDSDKTFTVPANKIWEILSIYVSYSSSADVGNRHLRIFVQNTTPSDILLLSLGILQAESLSRCYTFAPGLPRETAFFSTSYLYHPFPHLFLPAGYTIRILDIASIAAAADDMLIQMMVNEWDVS